MPLVTFFIFTFNQERYIRQAIESAIAQDYGNIEIIVSDDCSSDSTAKIIAEVVANYSGCHNLKANFNAVNLGIGQHVNKAFEMASGELLVFNSGDDVSFPNRVSRIVDKWLKTEKKADAIYSGAKIIDENGESRGTLQVALPRIDLTPKSLIGYRGEHGPLLLMGACAAYSADINRGFGPLMEGMNVEDIPLTVRASLQGGVIYIDEELLYYRENVSVWLPRKLQSEGFDRHRERLLFRINTNYLVAKQIQRDVARAGCDSSVKAAAENRLLATQFVVDCANAQCFLITRFFSVLHKTPYWRYALLFSIIVSNPRLHRLIYLLYKK